MSTWICAAVAIVALVVLSAAALAPHLSYRRLLIHRRVVVNLRSGNAIAGIVTKSTPKVVIVRDAVVHEHGVAPAPADGEILIERDHIDFIQATT
ncbi:hypothetical protein [Rhodococcus tibetensis]|uniref:Uncharacterized protein n=1 Tax=Rhodococcus tibetensis TaxID=2965064 RepID=A0ABT1QC93_9NOCA|nr:hypothetical protein [Rhodococcus sp. FXJ9.536]MCQ4119876.1 hypothetical protein [Rhodococcus sp. FXJ9.536]